MKNVWRFAFCSLTSAAFVVATAWAVPPRTANTPARQTAQAPQVQSVSGKITSIEKSSFTLAIASTGTQGQQFQDRAASPKTMTFTIDQNTTIDGKLKIGSSADVTYRQADGNNVAVSVRVAP